MKRLNIPKGPIARNRRYQRAYNKFRTRQPTGKCQFCSIIEDEVHEQKVVREHQLFWTIEAKFPYYIWDGTKAGEHLLLVPKRHIVSIAEFTPDERLEFVDLLAEYETRGYSVYARSATNKHKSIPHQHTHLIEVGKEIKTQFYLKSHSSTSPARLYSHLCLYLY